MKRSTKVTLGAMGLITAAWGVEQAMQPKRPPCPIGPNGQPVVTADCQVASSSRSGSSGSGSGGRFYGVSSSANALGAAQVQSRGGWGSFGRAFSGGGS